MNEVGIVGISFALGVEVRSADRVAKGVSEIVAEIEENGYEVSAPLDDLRNTTHNVIGNGMYAYGTIIKIPTSLHGRCLVTPLLRDGKKVGIVVEGIGETYAGNNQGRLFFLPGATDLGLDK